VTWYRHDGSYYEIFIYDGITTTNISLGSSSHDAFFPQINDSGHVVYQGLESEGWEIFLAEPICECVLVPDSYLIPRGQTLGFQATVYNYTGFTGGVFFGTKILLPGGWLFPWTGWMDGPFAIPLSPYGSNSGRISRPVASYAPLGKYTYYGFIGLPGLPIFDVCKFDFEVTLP
jgi:hypothetical protein